MKTLSASQWAAALQRVLDIIALLAIYSTGEISLVAMGVFTALLILTMHPRIYLPPLALAGLGIIGSFGGTTAWWIFSFHPLEVVAYVAPSILILLSASRNSYDLGNWRLGIGFLNLLIAAAISTEVFLSLAIVLYIVISSVTLSCRFLHRRLHEFQADTSLRQLPPAFIRNSILQAFVIFLCSAILFPILPRVRGHGGTQYNPTTTQVGYTEDVSLEGWTKLTGQGGGSPLIRIFSEKEEGIAESIPYGLLRAKVLDVFDGTKWRSGRASGPAPVFNPAESKSDIQLEFMREPIGSEVLPVPYGTKALNLIRHSEMIQSMSPRANGEWSAAYTSTRRARYILKLDSTFSKIAGAQDAPQPLHLKVPQSLDSSRMRSLARKVFPGQREPNHRIFQIRSWFGSNQFKSSSSFVDEAIGKELKKSELHPLEQFLFIKRQGHCEWFASATAVLLRLTGIPTRLVAGFILTRSPTAGVLTVRSGDAHAWVEAWIEGRGWIPVDTTPKSVRELSFLDYLADSYDLMSAYWSRYVLTFDADSRTSIKMNLRSFHKKMAATLKEKDELLTIPWVILAMAVLGFAYIPLAKRFSALNRVNRPNRNVPPALARERRRMLHLLSRQFDAKDFKSQKVPDHSNLSGQSGQSVMKHYEDWLELYQILRFGPPCDLEEKLPELRKRRSMLQKSLNTST